MHAAIRTYQVKPGTASEVSRLAQEGFAPIIRSVPGFVAYYGVIGESDTVVTVSIFEDEAGEAESTRQAKEWVAQNLAQHVVGPPRVVAGEVGWQA